MADNVSITPGTGTDIATDQIGGAHYQRVKVTFGVDGAAADVSAASPLPVSIGAAVPVTGTFWQATQPVSIASMPSTPVTGTFWQATQPVSGTVSVSGSVAVTGTFWQAIQPVSGTVTANAGTGTFAISAASLPLPSGASTAAKQPALGTAGTASADVLTVQGIASMTALKVDGSAVTQPVSGTVSIAANQTVDVNRIAGTTTATGNGVVSAGVQRVAIASDNTAFSVNATGPTLTKGTQGTTGFSTQPLRDARQKTLAMTAEFTFAQTAETLLTMTLSDTMGATTTFSSRVITSGKRMRIQSAVMQVELLGSGTAPQRAYLRMRANTAGATTTASARQWILPVGVTTAIVKSSNWASLEIPEGFELAGDGTVTYGFTLETPDYVATTATGRAFITVFAYEY